MKAYFFLALWAAFDEVWNITPETRFCRGFIQLALFHHVLFSPFQIYTASVDWNLREDDASQGKLVAGGRAFRYVRSVLSPIHRHTKRDFPNSRFIIPRTRPGLTRRTFHFAPGPLSNAHPSVLTLAVLIGKTTDVKNASKGAIQSWLRRPS